eukprot:TRINITY_DN25454_c0_g1_i1.p1 TRINITY_DN25454_c0_g1~~TRINITY_DN25454_c0_g1_i1.p1  ORF type:complete len:342 (+),score=126.94 TRINITY_DN25454_c0_g1_i1:41-1027(+)
MSDTVKEIDFAVTLRTGFRVAMKRWGFDTSKDRRRLFCYPGWLDNAGSFDNLGPLLAREGYDVIAVDPPGCGLTQHLPTYCTYNDFEEVAMIPDILEAINWTDRPCTIVGHSRGGGIALAAVSSFPDLFEAAVILESKMLSLSGVWYHDVLTPPGEKLKQAREQDIRNMQKSPRVFDSFEALVMHNYNNPIFPKSMETSKNISRRHAKQLPDGKWTFTHDVRTYGQRQKAHLSLEQNEDMMRAVKCPVLLVLASSGFNNSRWPAKSREVVEKNIMRRREAIKDLKIVTLKEGTLHHVHSDDAPQVADVIFPFLSSALPPLPPSNRSKL